MSNDDRAEQAFRDAFAEHGAEPIDPVGAPRVSDASPESGDTAEMGVVRAAPDRRFDARWALAAVIALIALAVPVGMYLQGRTGSPQDPSVATPGTGAPEPVEVADLSGLAEPKDGWKWVSRGDVAVQVPESWPYDDYTWMPWCLNGASEPTMPEGPFVELEPGLVPAIACEPITVDFVRMHVRFDAPSDGRPMTETLMKGVGASGVWVVLERDATDDDRALAEEILATATTFERDFAGCTPVGPFTSSADRPEPWDITTAEGVGAVGICRYNGYVEGDETPNLSGSAVLGGDEAAAWVRAIAAAPEGVSGNPDECLAGDEERSGVVLRVADATGVHDVYLRVDGCRNLGWDDGVTQRQLTDDCKQAFAWGQIPFYGGGAEASEACWAEPSTETTDPEPTEATVDPDPGVITADPTKSAGGSGEHTLPVEPPPSPEES